MYVSNVLDAYVCRLHITKTLSVKISQDIEQEQYEDTATGYVLRLHGIIPVKKIVESFYAQVWQGRRSREFSKRGETGCDEAVEGCSRLVCGDVMMSQNACTTSLCAAAVESTTR